MIANLNVCIEAMHGAMLSRRKALLVELSVGLAVFCSAGNADKAAIGTLKEVYASVGYDCVHRDGKDYTRIHWRAGASVALFNKLTIGLVTEWAGKKKDAAAINAIATQLNVLAFDSIDDVLTYCGKARVAPVPIEPAATGSGRDHVYHVKSGHLRLDIPDSTDVTEIMDMARKLLTLAEKIAKKAA